MTFTWETLARRDAKVARLAALKRIWDRDNVFHVNPNVTPAAASPTT